MAGIDSIGVNSYIYSIFNNSSSGFGFSDISNQKATPSSSLFPRESPLDTFKLDDTDIVDNSPGNPESQVNFDEASENTKTEMFFGIEITAESSEPYEIATENNNTEEISTTEDTEDSSTSYMLEYPPSYYSINSLGAFVNQNPSKVILLYALPENESFMELDLIV